jgi:plastocyanin
VRSGRNGLERVAEERDFELKGGRVMRRILFLLAALAALAVAPPAAAKTVTVAITRAGFVPATVAIEPGDTVMWRNAHTVRHSVVADRGQFVSPLLRPDETFSFTFANTGTIRYRDGTRPGVRGRVIVRSPALRASVSIASSRQIVIFGGSVTLSGTVSTLRAGETITLVEQRFNGVTTRTEVTTGTGGVWSFEAEPRMLTTYRAELGSVVSSALTVQVRPRISLRKVARTKFATTLVAARSFAGRFVVFSRWAPRLRRWVAIKRVYLRSGGTASISVATFRATIRRGTKLRLFLPQGQAAPGYLAGQSNFIVA